ncbi:MAG: tyrosine-protein phosphatase [Bacteroidota bacterium]
MFGKLFKKKKLKHPVDLSSLVADMHSHLIPGIDDGSPDMKTSLALIREMQALGYKKIITTPHISSDIFKNTVDNIQAGLASVKERLAQEQIDIQLEATAEYLLDDGFTNLLKKNEIQTFGNKHVLVELPYFHLPPNLYDITFELQTKGYRIILAHPERYLYWYNDMNKYEQLKDRGILFQLNIISLTGHYSPEVKKMAEKLIDANMIDFLGSDLHNFHYLQLLKNSTYEPYLLKAIESGRIMNHTL